ncbi:uncharacterized protein LOC134241241 [Saccostrea cucullata]|uniref:uncharacterized protein LOC134241241 n=1 Tax=Saccostrea cuccullata TaxID=36930 RepID=UPI002ED2933E
METVRSTTQCKVRQCSQCQEDTEFYCYNCNQDLCPMCKEKHVIDLDNLNHDVGIYREKLKIILKQESCLQHPDMIYEMYCYLCKLPFCAQCTEHIYPRIVPSFIPWRKHRKHNTVDIRTAYETNRRHHKDIIHSIRSQTLYKSCFLLPRIKTDIKTCHTKISNLQLEMSTKAQRLKGPIDTVVSDVKLRLKSLVIQQIKICQKQTRIMNGHLTSIKNYEHMCEQSAKQPVRFLFFIKNVNFLMIKETPNLTELACFSHTDRINKESVFELLIRNQITELERGQRQVKDEYVLKLMSTPVLQKSITITGFHVRHISRVSSDRVWLSDGNNLILANMDEKRRMETTLCILFPFQ